MTAKLAAFPAQPRELVIIGLANLWIVHVSPRGGFRYLSSHFGSRAEALAYAEGIAAERGWTVRFWKSGDPSPVPSADDGPAAA